MPLKAPFVMTYPLPFAVIGFVLFSFSSALRAASLEWADTNTGGDFFTAANWNPAQVPVSSTLGTDSITLGEGSYTVTKVGDFRALDMTIGAGVTLVSQGDLGWKQVDPDSYFNYGTILFNNVDSTWDLHGEKVEHTITNAGLVRADGIDLTMTGRNLAIDNTGGTIEAVNGGVFTFASSSITISGGAFGADETSSVVNNGVNRNLAMNGVAVVNGGQMTIVENTSGEDGNIQTTGFNITNAGSLNNSGSILIENRAVGDRRSEARIELSADSSFTNTGTITIDLVTGRDNAYADVVTRSDTLNQGVINIIHSGESVVGPIHYYDSAARFLVVGGDFTQTGAGSVVNLVTGGLLIADNVIISEGALTGNGTVSGVTSIGSSATLEPGNSIGVMTFEDSLTLEGTYVAEMDSVNLADLLVVDGLLDISKGSLQLDALSGGVGLGPGTFILASYGSLTGTFLSVVNNTGYDYSIDYGTGSSDDISVTLVPEPASFALLLSAVAMLATLRRRR